MHQGFAFHLSMKLLIELTYIPTSSLKLLAKQCLAMYGESSIVASVNYNQKK